MSEDKGFHPFHGRISKHFGHHLSASQERVGPDEPYLSYHDITLYGQDVESLGHDQWLTDNFISFWEEYLEHEELSKHDKCRVTLLRPSMAFLLMHTDDPESIKSALPDLNGISHVFLPMNDSEDAAQQDGGLHWSLLLVSLADGVAFHYDSLHPFNEDWAEKATKKLGRLVNRPLRFVELPGTPQQDNGSDCGVFVCLLMKHLLVKKLCKASTSEKVSMSVEDKHIDAYQGRKMMRHLVEDLRIEGARRRSNGSQRSHSRSNSPPRID